MSSANEHFINRCFQLAKKGINHVHPNPMVGCVITYPNKNAPFEQEIIGEGYHKYYGSNHAEVNAIKAVKDQSMLSQATVYVSLEPCSHYGKTPPCAELLVDKKIKKVVVASLDPNPLVAGKGVQFLEKWGIDVIVNVLPTDAKWLNRRFYTFHQKKRPYITLKWARSCDGFMNDASRLQTTISNLQSQQIVHQIRSTEAAIMIGANTAIIDNPSLTTRNWAGKNPVRVLLDTNLKTIDKLGMYNDGIRTLVINNVKSGVEENITYIKEDPKDLKQVMKAIHSQGLNSVLVEGGAEVLNSFINENLWDELFVFEAPLKLSKGLQAPVVKKHFSTYKSVDTNNLKHYINHN